MKWIVLEDDPTSDGYIAIRVVDEDKNLRIENKPCSIYKSSQEAMNRARQLREKFKVQSIKIFYSDATVNDF